MLNEVGFDFVAVMIIFFGISDRDGQIELLLVGASVLLGVISTEKREAKETTTFQKVRK